MKDSNSENEKGKIRNKTNLSNKWMRKIPTSNTQFLDNRKKNLSNQLLMESWSELWNVGKTTETLFMSYLNRYCWVPQPSKSGGKL